jgi:hypothetical protein
VEEGRSTETAPEEDFVDHCVGQWGFCEVECFEGGLYRTV